MTKDRVRDDIAKAEEDVFETALDDPALRNAAILGALGLLVPKAGLMAFRGLRRLGGGKKLSPKKIEQANRFLRQGQAAFGGSGAALGYAMGEEQRGRRKK